MKSRFFSRFDLTDDRNSEFVKDLKDLISLDDKVLTTLVNNIFHYSSLTYKHERNSFIEKLSTEIELELSKTNDSLTVLEFLLEKIVDTTLNSDTPSLWISDLKDQEVIPECEEKKFTHVLERLWKIGRKQYHKESRIQQAQTGVLPTIRGVNHTVELRGVFDQDYTIDKDISTFDSKIIDVVPIISVSISFEAEIQKEVYFQASQTEIENLINELSVALTESKQLLKNLSLKK